MTITEANAVNTILDYLLWRWRPALRRHHGRKPTRAQAWAACRVLARSANKALYAGWRESDVPIVPPESRSANEAKS